MVKKIPDKIQYCSQCPCRGIDGDWGDYCQLFERPIIDLERLNECIEKQPMIEFKKKTEIIICGPKDDKDLAREIIKKLDSFNEILIVDDDYEEKFNLKNRMNNLYDLKVPDSCDDTIRKKPKPWKDKKYF